MSRLDFNALIAAASNAAPTIETARRAIPLIDLTSLRGDETEDEIEALCDLAMGAGVAAVCVSPAAVPIARRRLFGSEVKLATVAAFPHGGDDLAAAAEEVAAAVAAGADEVDIVAPLEALEEGDIGTVGELVEMCRLAAGTGPVLKLILETGRLRSPDLITAAARAAVMAGIDFLKTSTGKTEVGATMEAAAMCLAVLAEADGRVGFKVSGGVRTATDAARYLALTDAMMPSDWVSPARFRFGASSLLDDLERVIAGGISKGATEGY